jgi:hypothetical protein
MNFGSEPKESDFTWEDLMSDSSRAEKKKKLKEQWGPPSKPSEKPKTKVVLNSKPEAKGKKITIVSKKN